MDSFLCSANAPGQSISFGLRGRSVTPIAYVIKTWSDYSPSPKLWVVEGSADGSAWIAVDRRDNNSDPNTKGVTGGLEIPRAAGGYRFIWLRGTEPDHSDH